jgi:hypothetical protein
VCPVLSSRYIKFLPYKSPSITYHTCCAGTWPGPSGRKSDFISQTDRVHSFICITECALGTNCGTPAFPTPTGTSPTPSFTPGYVPLGWTRTYNCAVDIPSRILTNVVTHQDFYTNSPLACINYCEGQGYNYVGLEYGCGDIVFYFICLIADYFVSNECHCGDGYSGTPTSAPESECNVGCTGDPYTSCGGSWRIRLYKKDSA